TLNLEVTLVDRAPMLAIDEGQWTSMRVALHSGEAIWHLTLLCPLTLGLAMVSRIRKTDDDRVSEAHVEVVLGGMARELAESLKVVFDRFSTECRIGTPEAESLRAVAAQTAVDADANLGASSWLLIKTLGSAVQLRLTPRRMS